MGGDWRRVRAVVIVERIPQQQCIFGRDILFGVPTYHRRELVTTAEHSDSGKLNLVSYLLKQR